VRAEGSDQTPIADPRSFSSRLRHDDRERARNQQTLRQLPDRSCESQTTTRGARPQATRRLRRCSKYRRRPGAARAIGGGRRDPQGGLDSRCRRLIEPGNGREGVARVKLIFGRGTQLTTDESMRPCGFRHTEAKSTISMSSRAGTALGFERI